MPSSLELFKQFSYIPNFVETGTMVGGSIQYAIEAGFKNIYSVEANPSYFDISQKCFRDNKDVHLYLGESQNLLPNMIALIKEQIVFWLDAHTQWDAYKIECPDPLMQELEIIREHPIKNHIILIDDWRIFKHPNYGILNRVRNINSNYKIRFLADSSGPEDILICEC